MGTGIVDTPSNFGLMGDRPTNPELLEYLTLRFMDGGMSIKQLHRDIMLSTTYQLASGRHARNEQIDGANRYFWRADRRRLDAESIRDAVLHVSGDLDPEVGGPSLSLRDEDNNRRTLYGEVSRFQVDEFLQTFDFPNPSLSAERRYTTNVPGQSLYFMNSPFVRRQAELLVKLLMEETAPAGVVAEGETANGNGRPGNGNGHSGNGNGGEATAGADDNEEAAEAPMVFRDREMIATAYPLLYSREATEPEITAGLEFLEERRAAFLVEEMEKLEDETSEETGMDASAGDASSDDADAGADAGTPTRRMKTRGMKRQGTPTRKPQKRKTMPRQRKRRAIRLSSRASMRAWVQYARALFSVAEFRFVN